MALPLHPFGRMALVVDLATTAEVHALAHALRRSPAPGQVDLVAAERSVLIVFDVAGRLERATDHILSLETMDAAAAVPREHEIPTVYDGEDLPHVADALGLTVAEVIAAHSAQPWTAAFTGFAPGFTYLTREALEPDGVPGDALTAEPHALELPRRATPRTAVPAGSVAVADRYSGIYPRVSPGGWHLLGRTDVALWDSERTPPALIAPGDTVRFVPVRSVRSRSESKPRASRPSVTPDTAALEIVTPGLQSLIEDGGRPGHLHDAVPRSGAADRASWSAGNEIVGNRPGAASIETVFGGLRVAVRETVVLAITGASPGGLVDGLRHVEAWTPFALRAGEELEVLAPTAGVRTYLAIRGGIDTAPELGSRSVDVLTGLGGRPLAAGDLLPIGSDIDGAVDGTIPHVVMPPAADSSADVFSTAAVELELVWSHRVGLFTDESMDAVTSTIWTVTADSNRVGVRLTGDTPLRLQEPQTLPSEGMLPGAVQVPQSGMPVVFLRDHPATGGYPVIGVVSAAGLDVLAQLSVGALMRFRVAG